MSGKDPDSSDPRATWTSGATSVEDPSRPGRPSPFDIAATERYLGSRTLGEGGIGRVCAVRDARLGREVAYKELSERMAGSAWVTERFGREAWVTAQLEHPGIVPVYDAGHGPDGRPYYTMRYVRGRSLQSVLAACTTLGERLALLSHFADVCQAMAYAHSRGVIHRDLKPANIMLGAFGETQIVDWGLARAHAESPDPSRRGLAAWPGDGSTTAVGAVMGTPAYMSPEQAIGGEVDERTDVWSLGVILYELLTGVWPFRGPNPTALLDAVREGDYVSVLDREPDAPRELAAVVARALTVDPDARYPSAGELRKDVDDYLAGRLVSAYAYSRWELLGHLFRPWRAPLLVAAVMTAGIAVMGVDSYQRIRAQRDRAQLAEEGATRHLNMALVEKARAATEAGAVPEAEVLAAHALLASEDPEARGVMARFGLATSPTAGAFLALEPACRTLALAGGGIACLGGDEVWLRGIDGVEHWRTPLEHKRVLQVADGAIVAVGDGSVALVDVRSGRVLHEAQLTRRINPDKKYVTADGSTLLGYSASRVDVTDLGRGVLVDELPACEASAIDSVAVQVDGLDLAIGCADGQVLRGQLPDPRFVEWTRLDEGVSLLVWEPGGDRLFVGGIRGGARVLGPEGEVPLVGLRNAVNEASWSPDGAHLVASSSASTTVLWSASDGVPRARLPARSRGALALSFADAHTVVTAGDHRVQPWQLPARWDPVVFRADAGMSSAAFSPDGARVVTTDANGDVAIWDRRGGAEVAVLNLGEGVAKRAVFSADGSLLAASSARVPDLRVFETHGWTEIVRLSNPSSFYRVGFTPSGSHVFGIDYLRRLKAWRTSDWSQALDGQETIWRDLSIAPAGVLVTLDDVDKGIWRVHSDGDALATERWIRTDTQALSHAAARDVPLIAVAPREQPVQLLDGQGRVHRLIDAPDLVSDVALSTDGRRLATSHIDRTVRVWDTASGRLQATLHGHTDRVVTVVFDHTGDALLSASWDGTARLWHLGALEVPAAELVAAAERRWNLDLEAAIANPVR